MSYAPSAPPAYNPEAGYVPSRYNEFTTKPTTAEEQKAYLKGVDVLFLCDRSGSMKWATSEEDETSRWDTVREYLKYIVQATIEYDPDGIEVCFFGSDVKWLKPAIAP